MSWEWLVGLFIGGGGAGISLFLLFWKVGDVCGIKQKVCGLGLQGL